jgi:hypothetical protein
MKTLFGLEDNSDLLINITDTGLPAEVKTSISRSLSWIAGAQLSNGGWGAGSHNRQDIRDPHLVTADPATTSVVSLALLRTGNTLTTGPYHQQLNKATEFLLQAIEQWQADQPYLTKTHRYPATTKARAEHRCYSHGSILYKPAEVPRPTSLERTD